jgi:UPF0755 protein
LKVKIVFLVILLTFLVLVAVYGAKVAKLLYTPVTVHHTMVEILPGTSGREIARLLYENEIITDITVFRFLIRWKQVDKTLKAGDYLFSGELTMMDTLAKILSGEIIVEKVMFPEGISLYRVFRTLSEAGFGDYDRFLNKALDVDFVREVTGFNINSIEGFLYPDTYVIGVNMSEESIIRFIVKNFFDRVHRAGIDITDQDSFYEMLTLASIVEKEAVWDDERPKIAGVFLNRLRIGMRLQACPTVTYHLEPQFVHKRRLTYSMTRAETPYNTYVIPGLPPQPICNPSVRSMLAVLSPEPSKYLFFFSDRRGRHIFSQTYGEHLSRQANRTVLEVNNEDTVEDDEE